ncbi:unnamed protein product, partial [marine sediment metagenome]
QVRWFDDYTLKMQILNIPAHPTRVEVKYLGPDETVRTTWQKQWEPFNWITA